MGVTAAQKARMGRPPVPAPKPTKPDTITGPSGSTGETT